MTDAEARQIAEAALEWLRVTRDETSDPIRRSTGFQILLTLCDIALEKERKRGVA